MSKNEKPNQKTNYNSSSSNTCYNNQQNTETKLDDNTLVIFDWDNTLWPTSQIEEKHVITYNSDSLKKALESSYKCVMTAIDLYGSTNIIIVTNGTFMWITSCLSNPLSLSLKTLLINNNIRIISSKDLWQIAYPGEYILWKELTFTIEIYYKYLKYFNKMKLKNKLNSIQYSIIIIGDGNPEIIASYAVINKMRIQNKIKKNLLLNRYILTKNPSFNTLINEHRWIIKHLFDSFLLNNKSNDIDLYFM